MNFDWDPDKNEEIQISHKISFQEIVKLISLGFLIKTVVNPSPKYQGQKIFLIRRGNAIYMVPFEKRQNKYRLITAFYSEFFTKKYLGR